MESKTLLVAVTFVSQAQENASFQGSQGPASLGLLTQIFGFANERAALGGSVEHGHLICAGRSSFLKT